jgi:hypothetical protein
MRMLRAVVYVARLTFRVGGWQKLYVQDGLQGFGTGGVGSLTEADVAAMWADDEDQDAALAEALLRQGPWSFEQ